MFPSLFGDGKEYVAVPALPVDWAFHCSIGPRSRSMGSPKSRLKNTRKHEVRLGQLQGALDSRVIIEQAKGVLAVRLGASVDEAFAALRRYARGHNQRLTDVARAVVESAPKVAKTRRARPIAVIRSATAL